MICQCYREKRNHLSDSDELFLLSGCPVLCIQSKLPLCPPPKTNSYILNNTQRVVFFSYYFWSVWSEFVSMFNCHSNCRLRKHVCMPFFDFLFVNFRYVMFVKGRTSNDDNNNNVLNVQISGFASAKMSDSNFRIGALASLDPNKTFVSRESIEFFLIGKRIEQYISLQQNVQSKYVENVFSLLVDFIFF